MAIGASGCAGSFDYDPPQVDLRGIDQTKYDRDVADCTDRKIAAGMAYNQPIISDCMRDRGYKVVEKHG